jgi:membrane protein DedA with SNARE-associated domain
MEWLRLAWDLFARNVYPAVFVASAIDATGFPFPGRLFLIAAGALAAVQGPNLGLVIALGAAGSILGDHLWYLVGRRGGDRVLDAVCRATFLSSRRCREGARRYYDRFGPATIVMARFSAVVRISSTALAASGGFGYARFLAYDVAGAVLWTALWVLAGYIVGDHWQALAERVGGLGLALTALVLAAVAAVVVARLWPRRRAGGAPTLRA